MREELPPQVGLGLLKRAAVAASVIVFLTAATVSAAGLLTADDLINTIEREGRKVIHIPEDEIDRAEAGEAQTIMILGSDERYEDRQLKIRPRSDTIILVRLDPDAGAIALMSIPRDLKVTIPGFSYPDKINSAYQNGGPRLTLKTVKDLFTAATGEEFEVNHIVNINFGGFRRAIDYIGCVYVDIDRRYFNDNSGGENYATIDVQPGYQKLCGSDALDYVRYRHTDNDLIRAARQQDFIRQVKSQDSVRRLMDFGKRRRIVRLFGRYFKSDASLREDNTLISVIKLLIFSGQKEIQEVGFKIDLSRNDPSYLHTTDKLLKETVDEFLDTEGSPVPRQRTRETPEDREFQRNAKKSKKKKNASSAIPGLEVAKTEGENMAVLARGEIDFPFYFPTLRTTGSRYALTEPRTYRLRDATGKRHDAYRLVFYNGRIGEYYGVQGTTWRFPPILDNPSDTKTVDGRKFMLFRTGRKVRIVAWRTSKGVYWVSNTLNQALDSRKMLGIAGSLSRLGGK